MHAPDPQAPHSTIYLWPGRFLMVSRAVSNRPHRHLAASLLIALDRPFELRVGRSRARPCLQALVAPNAVQSMDSGDAPVAVIHIDPDLDAWRRLQSLLGRRPCHMPETGALDTVRNRLRTLNDTAADCTAADRLFTRIVNILAGETAPQPLDPRIAELARRLRAQAPESPPLAALAAETGLSESRLMHLFKQEMGVTLRRFMLNLRLQSAMRLWRPDMNLAALAAEAGFYDQPHLARTAREIFDALPSSYTDPRRLRAVNCV